MTHRQESNLGYAFINMNTIQDVQLLSARFNGLRFTSCAGSSKACTVRPARLQGLEANVGQLGRRRRHRRRAKGDKREEQQPAHA
mmetsp:Transcript_100850/g.285793  ORF Transcript_100850/g.285793 Transcript_100850/m.285793 type:complete len:85 (+) Transcript_100850:1-255(+)